MKITTNNPHMSSLAKGSNLEMGIGGLPFIPDLNYVAEQGVNIESIEPYYLDTLVAVDFYQTANNEQETTTDSTAKPSNSNTLLPDNDELLESPVSWTDVYQHVTKGDYKTASGELDDKDGHTDAPAVKYSNFSQPESEPTNFEFVPEEIIALEMDEFVPTMEESSTPAMAPPEEGDGDGGGERRRGEGRREGENQPDTLPNEAPMDPMSGM